MKIKRAVISVSRKENLSDLALFLKGYDIEILSTGGTKKYLESIGANPIEVSSYTGFPEIMDGRVKTLHPKIHGGILNVRDNPEHQKAMETLNIKHIDMIVVNLYPFKEVISKGCTFEEAIENIDIGGPTMIRSAAKNFKYVTVVVDPDDYPKVMEDMKKHNGETSEDLRFYLAKKVFSITSDYDNDYFYLFIERKGLRGKEPMKVLILGSGGREHALVWKLSQSKDISHIYAIPGNGGISDMAECVEMDTGNIGNLIEFSRNKGIDLVVVGPETFLAQGIVDAFEEKGIPIFGPRRKGALIEASKIFAKELMDQYKVPTASFKTFSEYENARAYLDTIQAPLVIKADGLCAGKGAYVIKEMSEARRHIKRPDG